MSAKQSRSAAGHGHSWRPRASRLGSSRDEAAPAQLADRCRNLTLVVRGRRAIALSMLGSALSVLAVGASAAFGATTDQWVPFSTGASAYVLQGAGGTYSHTTSTTKDAWDFQVPFGTTVRAPFSGTVYKASGGCNPSSSAGCGLGFGNYVLLQAPDGTCAMMAHLSAISVSAGQPVARYNTIGATGNSGTSSTTHLHYGRMNCVTLASVPSTFVDAGFPVAGQTIVSGNGPEFAARMAVINGTDGLFVKEGSPLAAWTVELQPGDARAVALSGNRMYAINGCGASYLKDGSLTASWIMESGCNDTRAIAVTPTRLAMINGCGALYAKEGGADAAWIQELGCGDARAVALSGNRMYAINGCGASYLKDGSLTASWIMESGCNDTRAIAVTPTRLAIINGAGAMYTKDGAADASWMRQVGNGDAHGIALAN